jgi:hypothetical protein
LASSFSHISVTSASVVPGGQVQLDHLALPHVLDPAEAQRAQRRFHRRALRVQNARSSASRSRLPSSPLRLHLSKNTQPDARLS